MSLAKPADVRLLVNTPRNDDELQTLLTRVESQLVEILGAVTGSIVETSMGRGRYLYCRRGITTVTSVVQDTVTIDTTAYRVWGDQGTIERIDGLEWGWNPMDLMGIQRDIFMGLCTVTYTPVDDSARWIEAEIELVRLMLERTSMKSESVGREYSYTADDWGARRREIIRRLSFVPIG